MDPWKARMLAKTLVSIGRRTISSPTGDNGFDLSAEGWNELYIEDEAIRPDDDLLWLKSELRTLRTPLLDASELRTSRTLLSEMAKPLIFHQPPLDPERDALNSALTKCLATIERAGGGQAVAAALAVELESNDRSRRTKLMKNDPALKVDYLTAEASQGHEAMPRPWGLKEHVAVARVQSEYGSDQDKRLFHDHKRLFHSFRENHAKRDDVGRNLANRPAPIKLEEEAAALSAEVVEDRDKGKRGKTISSPTGGNGSDLSAEALNEVYKDAGMLEDRDKGKRVKGKVRREVIRQGRDCVASTSAESSDEVFKDAGMLEDRDKGKWLKAPQEVIWKGLEASPSAEALNEASKDAEMVEDRDKEKWLKAPWEVIRKGLKEPVEQFQSESASHGGSYGPFKLGMSHGAPIKDHFRHSSLRKKYARRGRVERNLATVELGGLAVAGCVEPSNFDDGGHRPSKLRKLKGLDHLSAEASRGHEAMAVSNDGIKSRKDEIKSENAGILEDPMEEKLCPDATRLENLPDDVLSFQILHRLSDLDLAKVGSVNKNIRRLSSRDELWKPRYKDEFGESSDSPEGLNWKQKFSLSTKRKRESERSSGPNKRKREIEGNE